MAEDENRAAPDDSERGGHMSEVEIDRTLNESFPASDPPSWTLGTDHRDEATPPQATDGDEE